MTQTKPENIMAEIQPIEITEPVPKGYRVALPEEQRPGEAVYLNDLFVKPLDTQRLKVPKKKPPIVDFSSSPAPLETETKSSLDAKEDSLAKREKALKQQGSVASVMPGLTASSQQVPTTDATSAVWQAVGSGISGAAGGALIGSSVGGVGAVPGAVIGGISGLVMGTISAYTNLKAARQQRRAANKQARKIMEMQRKAQAQQRRDINEHIRYNRRINALQSRWDAVDSAREMVNKRVVQNQKLRDALINTAR